MSSTRGEVEGEAVDEDVLQISQFLTSFQTFFRLDDDPEPEPFFVTPSALSRALAYQRLRIEKEECEERAVVFERRNRISCDEARSCHRYSNTIRQHLDAKISALSEETLRQNIDILNLLERIQVWITKAMAQDWLLCRAPTNEDQTETIAWSMLLNLPSAEYANSSLGPPPEKFSKSNESRSTAFSDIFEKIFYESAAGSSNRLYSLAITPNVYTWPEFSKYIWMISKLQEKDRDRLHRSQLSKINKKDLRETTSVKFQFDAVDLVALWIRAQRNTCAYRHLHQLFKVEVRKGKFSASFLGNHGHMSTRVWVESPLLDNLISSLVTCQVLCVGKKVRNVMESIELPPDAKRLRQESYSKFKRRKVNMEDGLSGQERTRLLRCCTVVLLRTWATQNRKALEILFHENVELQRQYSRVPLQETTVASIAMGLPKSLGKNFVSLSDLEEQLLLGKLDPGALFDEKLVSLVASLMAFMENKEKDTRLLAQAINAWSGEMKRFYSKVETDGIRPVCRLMMDESEEDVDLRVLERSVAKSAAPWLRTCGRCHKKVEKSSFKVCDCCQHAYHATCCSFTRDWNVHAFTEAYPPLMELCRLRVPSRVPDFRMSSVRWKTKVIKIDRTGGPDGKVKPLGISVKTTRSCARALEQVTTNKLKATELSSLEYPLAVDRVGLIVTEIDQGGCCDRKGMLINDVIVGIELVQFGPGTPDRKFQRKVYTFSAMTEQESLTLLRTTAVVVKLIVDRPHLLFLERSKSFLGDVMYRNESTGMALQHHEHMRYCFKCTKLPEAVEDQNKTYQVVHEAKVCRDILRYLSSQEFAGPFLFEEPEVHESDGYENEPSVSLRRLELMMIYIISSVGAPNKRIHHHAYYSRSKRVAWVLEGYDRKPMELLCKGISLLAHSPRAAGSNSRPFSLLLTEFLRTSCAWCLAVAIPEIGLPRQMGSRHCVISRSTCSFFDPPSCFGCSVRAVSEPGLLCSSCEALRSYPIPDLDHGVLVFEKRSAVVGSTILLIPGDPLFETVMKCLENLKIAVDHYGRPLEMVVAAYLPKHLTSTSQNTNEWEGLYYLLPVANITQVRFLLSQCELQSLSSLGEYEWTSSLLGLDGVVSLSVEELEARIEQTQQISSAVSEEIIKQACCLCSESKLIMLDGVAGEPSEVEEFRKNKVFPCQSSCGMDFSLGNDELRPSKKRGLGLLIRLLNSFVKEPSKVFNIMFHKSTPRIRQESSEVQIPWYRLSDQSGRVTEGVDKGVIDATITGQTYGQKHYDAEVTGTTRIGKILPVRHDMGLPPVDGEPRIPLGGHQVENGGIPISARRQDAIGARATQTETIRGSSLGGTEPSAPSIVILSSDKPVRIRFDKLVEIIKLNASRALESGRKMFNLKHLNMNCEGVIFSLAETATFVHGCTVGLPMVAMRMLMPRYKVDVILRQFKILPRLSLSRVPLLSEQIWDHLLRMDFERDRTEKRMAFPSDSLPELGFYDIGDRTYCFPRLGFGVDNEIYILLTYKGGGIQRIRGGGSTEETVSRQHLGDLDLSALPKDHWDGQLVLGECETTLRDNSQGISLCIGHIASDEEAAAPGVVTVSLFYISRVGILGQTILQEFEELNLQIPGPGSEALEWEKRFIDLSIKKANGLVLLDESLPGSTSMPRGSLFLLLYQRQLLEKLKGFHRLCIGRLSSGQSINMVICDPRHLYVASADGDSRERSKLVVLRSGRQICALFRLACEELAERASEMGQNTLPEDNYETVAGTLRLISQKATEKMVMRLAKEGWDLNLNEPRLIVCVLFCLYDVYQSGECLWTPNLSLSSWGLRPYEWIRKSQYVGDRTSHGCDLCKVCALPNERVFGVGEHGKGTGIGCASMRQVFLPVPEDHNVFSLSPLQSSKKMLLNMAGHIPDFLKTTAPLSSFLWKGDSFDSFRKHVREASSVRLLYQALVILRWSIDTKRLPDWWAQDAAGWSTSQFLMSSDSPFALLMHLQALDLAIAEACIEYENKPLAFLGAIEKESISPIDYETRIKEAVQRCKILNVQPYEGESNFFCSVCQDGGDLVICEHCPNVVHLGCCRLTKTPDVFVCPECISDLAALAKSN